MEEKITDILQSIQLTSVNHQKNLKHLEYVYNSVDHGQFLEFFLKVIQGVLQEDYNNQCTKILLEFLAKFVGYFARAQNANEPVDDENDIPTHPFITAVIKEVLKHHDIPQQEHKYNTCNFLSQILHYVGERTQMDSEICDAVQRAMLENLQDKNYLVRLQAVSALSRLQDPFFPECPVIRAYIHSLRDSHHMVRGDVVKRIAPTILSLQKLIEKVLDIDANVRCAAYTRIGEIGVRQFKIESRQFILKCGFSELNQKVKKTFLEFLLPKWMTVLNGDYIAFLIAIKLDAEESDILSTEELSSNSLEVFFKSDPIDNLLKALPVDENKIIPLNVMKKELALYWNILTGYLRKCEDMEEYLDSIIPELTTFCNYIEKLIDTKLKKSMEEWEYLDFQYMLYHLFDIADQYDFSEEVGRRTLDNLLKKVLRNYKFHSRLLNKLMAIASKLASSKESFANEICIFISDIREPLIEEKISDNNLKDNEFQLVALKVKVNILEGELEDAVSDKDFQKAQLLKNEIEEYRRKMEALNVQPNKQVDNDVDVCWCLDLLSALLINGNIKALSPSLMTCRQEFLNPLIESTNAEIEWRVFKCIAAYCVFDKQIAEEYVKKLMIPITKYRALPNFNNVKILISSIAIITDIIRLYGTGLFGTEEDPNSTSSTHTSARRRLYNNENEEIPIVSEKLTLEIFVNVVLDMLDDENSDIRDVAMESVTKLILNGFGNSSMVISRLILKWYNPATQKTLQQKLGLIIKDYTEHVKDAKLTIATAVVPILTSIAEAPRTSPLADVDIENAVRFLGVITDSRDLTCIHRDIGHTLIREIAMRPAEVVTPYFAKMLNILNIVPDDSPPTKELIGQAELLLANEALNKIPKQNIEKFISKLKGHLSFLTSMRTVNTSNESTIGQSSVNETASNKRLDGILEETDKEDEEPSIESESANGDAASKIGRTEPTEKASDDDAEKLDVIETQEKPPGVVQTNEVALQALNTQGKLSESDPDVISPSISPESQENVIHNLRKRTRSSYVQESSSKKQNSPESISKKVKRTAKPSESITNTNNSKVVASSKQNIEKEKEQNVTSHSKETNKNGEEEVEILTGSSGLSDTTESSGSLRKSLRVIPSEKVPTDGKPESLEKQKNTNNIGSDISHKENRIVVSHNGAGHNAKKKRQNRENSSKNSNKTSTDGSSQEFVSSNNNTKQVGKRRDNNKVLDQEGSDHNAIPITKTSTLQRNRSLPNGVPGVDQQSDSKSKASINTRSRLTSLSVVSKKRTSSYVQESLSKKQNSPESISKKVKRTAKPPESVTNTNNSKVVAPSKQNIEKEKEQNITSHSKETNKNGEKEGEILTDSSGLSDTTESSGSLRRSLRVIPSEKVPIDGKPESLVKQKNTNNIGSDISNKENRIVVSHNGAGHNAKKKRQNRGNSSKNANKTSTDGSSREFVSSNNNTKQIGKRRDNNKVLDQEGSDHNAIPITKTSTLQRNRSLPKGVLGVDHQSDSTSEASTNTRSRSTSSSVVSKKRTRLKKKLHTKRPQSLRKQYVQSNSKSDLSSTRSRSKSLSSSSSSSSEKVASENNKMPGTNRNTRSVTKDAASKSANPVKLPLRNDKAKSQKTLFQNHLRSKSQSNGSDAERVKETRVNKAKGKDVENIRVIDKEVQIRVNGLRETVGKVGNPQVKRKKGRTKQANKETEESVRNITENLGDISDQSLHTIIEPSEFHMSLLSDDSPENSPQKSLQNSKRQRTIISESSSESEALNSSVRKSSRKKKKIVR